MPISLPLRGGYVRDYHFHHHHHHHHHHQTVPATEIVWGHLNVAISPPIVRAILSGQSPFLCLTRPQPDRNLTPFSLRSQRNTLVDPNLPFVIFYFAPACLRVSDVFSFFHADLLKC